MKHLVSKELYDAFIKELKKSKPCYKYIGKKKIIGIPHEPTLKRKLPVKTKIPLVTKSDALVRCPGNPDHKRFLTTAHEVHDWEVDEVGDFIKDKGCSEVASKPDLGNVWVCATCGKNAEKI